VTGFHPTLGLGLYTAALSSPV